MRLVCTGLVLACLLGCGGGSGDAPVAGGLPEYPAEPGPADFPGITYASHAGPIPLPATAGGPVWLIGIDGATWAVAQPMIDRGELPALAGLVERGRHGTLVSEEPTISPALWATIATGYPRFVHGVENFLVKLPGSYETDEAGPLDRRSPALWDLVGAAGGTADVIGWFGSYPAEPIRGRYVSKGFDPARPRPGQVYPESLAAVLRDARVRLRPDEVEAIARSKSLEDALVSDARTMAALRELAADGAADLTAMHFSGIDVAQHLSWRHMEPRTQAFPQDGPPDPGMAGVIPAYYRFIDRCLAELLALAPASATFVIVSDHGAGPMRADEAFHFQLEVLLQALGLMDGPGGPVFAIDELYRHDKRIWLNLEDVEPLGTVPVDDADARAREIERRLAALRTDDGEPVFAALVRHTGEDGWTLGDPALTVRFSRAALFTEQVHDDGRRIDFAPVRLRHADVSGSHRPEGIVIVAGPDVDAGPLDEPISLYHVAPTVLYLLGLPQDARMLARAPADGGVIDQLVFAERPVRQIETYAGTDRTDVGRPEPGDPTYHADREESLEKLRALGYIR